MKNINFATGMGSVCLVFIALFFWGTAWAGYCINKDSGKLVRCTVEKKQSTSKKPVSVKHQGVPARLTFEPCTENKGLGKKIE